MRVHNFSAGPAALPVEVLQHIQSELLDWQGSGMSVMEISHRSKAFIRVAEQAEQDLRDLLSVPANYKVLFLQGGATGQFAAVPLNLAVGRRHRRLCEHRQLVEEGHWRGAALLRARQRGRGCRRIWLQQCSRGGRPGSAAPMPPTCTTRPTRPSVAWRSRSFPRSRMCRWSRTTRRRYCRRRWMYRASA